MYKNLFLLLLFTYTLFFFISIFNQYISLENKTNILKNREQNKILSKTIDIPFLKNDTNSIIEFNDGYNDINKNQRKFWEVFSK